MSTPYVVLGIAGTAKNTGKTTTTMALLDFCNSQGLRSGLTSIGYDGESVDNITGLPKPRLFVPRGTLVVTAARCLEVSSAKLKRLEVLPIPTPLGNLVCGRVEREGLVVAAGPNQTRHLHTVREWFHRHGAEVVLVDGALNRMAPMAETDGLILATGASYKPDSRLVAVQAEHLAEACNRPSVSPFLLGRGLLGGEATVVWDKSGGILASAALPLLDARKLELLARVARQASGFYCPGLVTPFVLKRLLEMPFPRGMTYIFENPVKVLAGNEPDLIHEFLVGIEGKGGLVVYHHSLPLLAITVNPFYPKYRHETNHYEPAYVERTELKQRVAEAAKVPVFDVLQDDCGRLAKAIRAFGV